jgi:hypothetical protein
MLATACFTPFLLFLPELCNISKSDLSTHRAPTKLGHSEKTNPENPSGLHERTPTSSRSRRVLPSSFPGLHRSIPIFPFLSHIAATDVDLGGHRRRGPTSPCTYSGISALLTSPPATVCRSLVEP